MNKKKMVISYTDNIVTPFRYQVELINLNYLEIDKFENLLTKILQWVESNEKENKIVGYLDDNDVMNFFQFLLSTKEFKNIKIDFNYKNK